MIALIDIGGCVVTKTMTFAKLEANAPAIAQMLGVLANKERFRIVCRLVASNDELSMSALAAGSHTSQSALSQHLSKLREGGIISARRVGHNSYFQLADPRAATFVTGMLQILNHRDRK